ncbi:phage head closure protein [Enterovirga rhinocerotis]|uniref:SPP1 family predicted phage head-tail adaptor n=1 Tax=Enterovirga rhinocerotis TaxID=1339210 RepID=A0A4R7BXM9_9HYPH|nr:phage head closure protein [Enterovirga rhinocerotis]TDR88957.1 SPP1 family predicted phage head-tail adaptor [Enterovirga rhinocerotis]
MSARPEIGARGRRFTLEVPQETPDGFGGVIRSYQPGPRLWGAIALLSTMERIRADRAEAAATHRVTFAFRDDLTPDRRLTLGTRRFRIRSASDPDGRRRSTVCLVEEIAG